MILPHEHRFDDWILNKTTDGTNGQFNRVGTFRVTGDSDAVRVMKDIRSMADELMYEKFIAVDTYRDRLYTASIDMFPLNAGLDARPWRNVRI